MATEEQLSKAFVANANAQKYTDDGLKELITLDPPTLNMIEQSINTFREEEFENEKAKFLKKFPSGKRWIDKQVEDGVDKSIISQKMLAVSLYFAVRRTME